MKKLSTLFHALVFSVFSLYAQPNFDLVGYATLNGGTTGGKGGKEIVVSSFDSLKKYAEEPETPYIIKVTGTITGIGSIATKDYNGSIKVASNKTIEGVGKTGFLKGAGFMVLAKKNIIIRNLKITMSGIQIPAEVAEIDIPDIYSAKGDEGRAQILVNDGDCIAIKGASSNVWIDHCEVYNEDPKKQLNVDLYDGLIDIKNASSFVTVSWCYLHDHHKCTLVGSSDKDEFERKITFHHNYFSNIDERMPSFRFGTAHVFNNYYHGLHVTGINSRMGACLKIEKNHFENSKDPICTRNSKVEGKWDVADNKFTQCTGSQPASSTCVVEKIPYDYAQVLTEVGNVKREVIKYAGVGKR